MNLVVSEDRVPPARGLVLIHNAKGKLFNAVDLKRWLRLNRTTFNTAKVDVLTAGRTLDQVSSLFESAEQLDLRLSLRTDCAASPTLLSDFKARGLYDVFLCPRGDNEPLLDAWLEAASDLALPVRLQLQAPFWPPVNIDALAARIAAAGVTSVNVAAFDPFRVSPPCRDAQDSRRNLTQMNALASALTERGVEANLIALPLCLVSEDNRVRALNRPQFFLDHQQYARRSYELAASLWNGSPIAAGKILLALLARATFQRTFVDAVVLRLFLNARHPHQWLLFWHKLKRHIRSKRGVPNEMDSSMTAAIREWQAAGRLEYASSSPECHECALRFICDHDSDDFRRVFPGLRVTTQQGEVVLSPMHFTQAQPKYYDSVDAERVERPHAYETLAREANDLMAGRTPDQRLMPHEYTVEHAPFERLEGGVRWHSVTNAERQSSVLARLEPPFTLAVTFGGGIAEYVGFSFGRHSKVVCPMEAYRHALALHVTQDGHYVLLRDGRAVRPTEFEGPYYVPLRLGGRLEPRISIWGIDGSIVTQFVEIWHGPNAQQERPPARYSVVLVNTRYTRRLQAALLSIAHQTGFDLGKLEVIVSYVPGLDATDDLIDGMQAAFPQLRVVRSPFPAQNAQSKGFMINESVKMASGEWIVLMDADIVLAPAMFARIEQIAGNTAFIAPDGRKMLDKETTGRILLGEIEPWRQWEELLNGPGEYRHREAHGVPVGFFQCFKASALKKLQYAELEHFEGADMWFGMGLQHELGKETRLSGLPVLHLDHGGSQWYGTQKHF